MKNPFKFGTIVEGEYFTDRVNELAAICTTMDIKKLMQQGYLIRSSVYEIEDPFFMRWIQTRQL